LKSKIQQLRTSYEIAEKVHNKERAKYQQIGDTCLRLRGKLDDGDGVHSTTGSIKLKLVSH